MVAGNRDTQNLLFTINDHESRLKRLETQEFGTSDFVLIEHEESAFTFTSIPDSYRHLFIVHSVRGSGLPPDVSLLMTCNTDTGANYFHLRRTWLSTIETTLSQTGQTALIVGQEGTSANRYSAGFILIPDYVSSSKYKTFDAGNFVGLGAGNLSVGGGVWQSTAAITSLEFSISGGSFVSGSVISLYGIR